MACNLAPRRGSLERQEAEAGLSRWIRGLMRLVLDATGQVDFQTYQETLQHLHNDLNGVHHEYSVQRVSTTHCSLKTASLKVPLAVHMEGKIYLVDFKYRGGGKEPLITGIQDRSQPMVMSPS